MLLHNVFQNSRQKRMPVKEQYPKVLATLRLKSDICFICVLLCIESFPFDKHKYFCGDCLDSEYLEFLEALAKPIENLPSAEIQLERKEAERSG